MIQYYRMAGIVNIQSQHNVVIIEKCAHCNRFIETVEQRQGLKIAAPEESAWRLGFIDDAQLRFQADAMGNGDYANYLRRLLSENN